MFYLFPHSEHLGKPVCLSINNSMPELKQTPHNPFIKNNTGSTIYVVSKYHKMLLHSINHVLRLFSMFHKLNHIIQNRVLKRLFVS